jgi:hypothetical protein
MNVHTQISDYLAAQPDRKRGDMQALHSMMLRMMPDARVWFLDGKDESGRTVSNPNIGYGLLTIAYYGGQLGKASVSGFCIKFSALRNINLGALEAAIRDGIARTST